MGNMHWDLIAKYLSENCTKEEEQTLLAWIKSDPDNEFVFKQAQKAWNASVKKAEFSLDTLGAWEKLKSKLTAIHESGNVISIQHYRSKMKYYMVAAAASIVLLIGIGYLLKGPSESNYEVIACTDHMEVFYLPDSSLIYLNKNSQLKYSKNFDQERKVELLGEAYFEVKRNPSSPFTIQTKNSTTRVLGTSFNIRSYESEVEEQITVTSGEVEYTSRKESTKTLLHKDDKAVIHKKEGNIQKSKNEDPSVLAWKDDKGEIKKTRKYKEEQAPLKYLSTDFQCKDNLVKQAVVEGNLYNAAIFTTYNNIKMKAMYVDKHTQKVVEHHFEISRSISPGATTKYKHKLGKWFDGAQNIKVEIVEAKVSE